MYQILNFLSANLAKWSNTLKLFSNCLSVFDHFVRLALKGLTTVYSSEDILFLH